MPHPPLVLRRSSIEPRVESPHSGWRCCCGRSSRRSCLVATQHTHTRAHAHACERTHTHPSARTHDVAQPHGHPGESLFLFRSTAHTRARAHPHPRARTPTQVCGPVAAVAEPSAGYRSQVCTHVSYGRYARTVATDRRGRAATWCSTLQRRATRCNSATCRFHRHWLGPPWWPRKQTNEQQQLSTLEYSGDLSGGVYLFCRGAGAARPTGTVEPDPCHLDCARRLGAQRAVQHAPPRSFICVRECACACVCLHACVRRVCLCVCGFACVWVCARARVCLCVWIRSAD